MSPAINLATPVSEWTEVSVTAVVPKGTAVMQAVITNWQCSPYVDTDMDGVPDADTSGECWDGNGGVYWDNMSMVAGGK